MPQDRLGRRAPLASLGRNHGALYTDGEQAGARGLHLHSEGPCNEKHVTFLAPASAVQEHLECTAPQGRVTSSVLDEAGSMASSAARNACSQTLASASTSTTNRNNVDVPVRPIAAFLRVWRPSV